MNHQPESRMRENRLYGSEGGGTGYPTGPSYPYPDPISVADVQDCYVE